MLQDWLQRFNDDREKRIAQTKKDNAAQEKDATKGPTGDTDWAKVCFRGLLPIADAHGSAVCVRLLCQGHLVP